MVSKEREMNETMSETEWAALSQRILQFKLTMTRGNDAAFAAFKAAGQTPEARAIYIADLARLKNEYDAARAKEMAGQK